jgi:membrane protein implicated in regulation of membrane protease activity
MIGGVVRVMENRAGQVKVFCRAEIWEALCTDPVVKDEKVQITGMDQMKLLVRPGRTRERME